MLILWDRKDFARYRGSYSILLNESNAMASKTIENLFKYITLRLEES